MTKLPAVKTFPSTGASCPRQRPQDPAFGGRGGRTEGKHQGPRAEAEPGRPPRGRREGRPRRHRRRAAVEGPAGARRRGRHCRRLQGAVPGRGAGRGPRDIADGEHHPRRDAPGTSSSPWRRSSMPAPPSRRSPPASACRSATSRSACACACAWASSRRSCSTPIGRPTSASVGATTQPHPITLTDVFVTRKRVTAAL